MSRNGSVSLRKSGASIGSVLSVIKGLAISAAITCPRQSFILRAMQKASRTLWHLIIAVLLVSALTAGGARASEFKSYKKPNPKRFAEGVAAYDARNYAQAYDIWLPLARHGDLAALFNIGLMLRDGRGIPEDLPRALSFFGQCAKQEHLGCQVNLADMYYKGVGTKQNYAEAAHWLMVAARRGHFPSMFKLAGMFERGQGDRSQSQSGKTAVRRRR